MKLWQRLVLIPVLGAVLAGVVIGAILLVVWLDGQFGLAGVGAYIAFIASTFLVGVVVLEMD